MLVCSYCRGVKCINNGGLDHRLYAFWLSIHPLLSSARVRSKLKSRRARMSFISAYASLEENREQELISDQ